MTRATADKILDLMARECERAYRRGFQQGQVIGPHLSERQVFDWRYRNSLAKAPTPENGKPLWGFETPRQRLEIESKKIAQEVERLLRRKPHA